MTRQALEELLPVAKAHDVGVAVMKPLSAKTSTLVTCLYNPSLSLVSDEPELRALLGEDNRAMVGSALRYVLAQDVSVVVPGLKTIGEVEIAAKVGEEYKGLTREELKRFNVPLGESCCRDCGQCLPCPQNLNIAAILRFHTLYGAYGLKNWAKKLYGGLEIEADNCVECGECELKCPYQLPIVNMLRKAQFDLQR